MKKLFSVFAITVLAFTVSSTAQEVKFGAKAGVNFSDIGGEDLGDTKGKTGFHVGAVAEIVISDKFSVQPELVYSSQGIKASEGDGELALDYINLPILAKFYVAENFSLEAGPQVGFLASAKSKFDGDSEDVKDFVSGIDLGVGVGAGFKMEGGLNFAARYNLGISNINDGDGSDDFKNQNNVIQVSVGYFFN